MGIVQDLLAERAVLDVRINEETRKGKVEALQKVKQLAQEFGLTSQELARVGGSGTPYQKTGPRPPKYRDPDTGTTWTGAGIRPGWLKAKLATGKKLESFLIAPPTPAAKAPVKKPKPAVKEVVKK